MDEFLPEKEFDDGRVTSRVAYVSLIAKRDYYREGCDVEADNAQQLIKGGVFRAKRSKNSRLSFLLSVRLGRNLPGGFFLPSVRRADGQLPGRHLLRSMPDVSITLVHLLFPLKVY